jgi:hypothetical protein
MLKFFLSGLLASAMISIALPCSLADHRPHRSPCPRGNWHRMARQQTKKWRGQGKEAPAAAKDTKGIISAMNNEQKEALFGPSTPFADHKAGDFIQFRRGAEVKHGKILHVRAPAPTHQGGTQVGLRYIVDADMGFPVIIAPSQIIHGSFPAILASYGCPDSTLQSREEAERLATSAVGQVITNESDECPRRLRVLSARVEGDEKAGRVVAECEAMGSEEGSS